MTAVVWIRRALRSYDNTALAEASKNHDEITPLYIVDEDYFSNAVLGYPRVKFWRESVQELKQRLRERGGDLVVRKGWPVEQIRSIADETGAEQLYFNRDYSPYARKRDRKIVEKTGLEAESFKDVVLHEKKEIVSNSGNPYKVFSYYRDKWFEKQKPGPRKPESYEVPGIESDPVPSLEKLGFERPERMKVWKGGREKGLERLKSFKDSIWSYRDRRDFPAENATSKLSPHLKFGTVSIREAFHAAEKLKSENPERDHTGIEAWQRQLAWRDFYLQLLWNHPETVEKPMKREFEALEWRSKDEAAEDWKRFKSGRTGFPFVDAGMRQLKKTGWMHNRLRMLVTSFACKDLWLDWHDLHDYFSRMFVDAETAAMIGGIQWAYSIGTDAQPYFRVFNPWLQGEKYDPDGKYIRQNIPELENVPGRYIHRPHEMPREVQKEYSCVVGRDYPVPMVDHEKRREKAVERFREAREKTGT